MYAEIFLLLLETTARHLAPSVRGAVEAQEDTPFWDNFIAAVSRPFTAMAATAITAELLIDVPTDTDMATLFMPCIPVGYAVDRSAERRRMHGGI